MEFIRTGKIYKQQIKGMSLKCQRTSGEDYDDRNVLSGEH